MSEQRSLEERPTRRRRHEITVDEVKAMLDRPLTQLVATAHGPKGSKTIEVVIALGTSQMAFVVNDRGQHTYYSDMGDAVNAYHEAPGP